MLKKDYYSTFLSQTSFSLQACTINYYYVYLHTFITIPNLGFSITKSIYNIISKYVNPLELTYTGVA